jgi:hypothetical protein
MKLKFGHTNIAYNIFLQNFIPPFRSCIGLLGVMSGISVSHVITDVGFFLKLGKCSNLMSD